MTTRKNYEQEIDLKCLVDYQLGGHQLGAYLLEREGRYCLRCGFKSPGIPSHLLKSAQDIALDNMSEGIRSIYGLEGQETLRIIQRSLSNNNSRSMEMGELAQRQSNQRLQFLAGLTYGLRTACFEQVKIVYQIQIKDVALGDAVKDVLLTKELKRGIEKDYIACEAKAGQEQIKCVTDTAKKVKKQLDKVERKAEKKGIKVRGIKVLQNQTMRLLGLNNFSTQLQADIITTTAIKGLVFAILKGIQWVYSQCMELGQLVTGLYGPIALTLSLFELPFPPLYSWLLGFLTIALINWSYALMVGLICWVMVLQGAQAFSDLGFLFFLTIGAPGSSIYFGKSGGAAIYENFLENGALALRIAFLGGKLFL